MSSTEKEVKTQVPAETAVENSAEEKHEMSKANEISNEDMLKMYDDSFSNYESGQIVTGTVVSVNDREILVDIGYKSEGSIPIGEFTYSGSPEVGTDIKVYIVRVEDGEGKVKLSKKQADFQENIQKLQASFEKEEVIEGIFRRRVKGGMIVEVFGLEAFLPGSQIALKPIPNLDQFIGKTANVKIIKLDGDRKNIIVSRKDVLEEEVSEKREKLREIIEVGAELEGEVKNITSYGAFIDLGGIDGLLHITDMSWGKINHPSDILNIGDKLKVKVTAYEPENEKVSLGLKQLVPQPWENIESKYEEGTRAKGKVVNLTPYGAFVELEPGVEGLIHITEMSWTKKITHPNQILKLDETVEAIILSVDKERKRIALGLKQMEPNPWVAIDMKYPEGTILKRKIKSLTDFGVFVEVEDGIDGLVHVSDISWTKRIYHPKDLYKKNQEIEAVVLSIDKSLHRVALGIKQLHVDPWQSLNEKLPLNTEIIGKISKLIPKGILVDIESDDDVVEGFVPVSHLAIPKLDTPDEYFVVGEEIPLKVIELDMDNRRLILSVKAFFFSREQDTLNTYVDFHKTQHEEIMKKKEAKKAKAEAKKEAKKDKIEAPVTEETIEKIVEETPEAPMAETVVEDIVEEVVEETPQAPIAETVVEETLEAPLAETVVEEVVEETPEVKEEEETDSTEVEEEDSKK
ncbi:30S ribosomal protein S1 [bacterium]|nr:30S ribosomal protein S1 [bacterium]